MDKFKYFRERCEFWVKKLGVGDWDIEIERDTVDTKGTAKVRLNHIGKNATIYLLTKVVKDYNISKKDLNICALHEVLHLVFSDLIHTCQERYYSEDSIDRLEHGVIRRLEKLI